MSVDVVTVVGVAGGQGDVDAGERVVSAEVDHPPRERLVIVAARERLNVVVERERRVCARLHTQLNRIAVARHAVT